MDCYEHNIHGDYRGHSWNHRWTSDSESTSETNPREESREPRTNRCSWTSERNRKQRNKSAAIQDLPSCRHASPQQQYPLRSERNIMGRDASHGRQGRRNQLGPGVFLR